MTRPVHHSLPGGGDACRESSGMFMWRRIANDTLSLGLVAAIIMSMTYPSVGITLGNSLVTRYSNHVIFFIAGLRLRFEEIRDSQAAVKSFAWGVFSTLLLTPCMGSLIIRGIPCSQRELSIGATVLVCMPSAVSSSATLTIQAGGNLALSVLLAVTCHALSVCTIPFLLQRLAGLDIGASSGQLSAWTLILRLSTATLVPLSLGEATYMSSQTVREFVQKNKPLLTAVTNLLVVLTPWRHLSVSSQSGTLAQVTLPDLLRSSSVSLLLPLAFFTVNHVAASSLGLPPDYVKSVTIVTSSKTLPVAMTVIEMLPASMGDAGLLAVPGIIIYFSHIVVCSLVARRWSSAAEAALEQEGPHTA